MKLLLFSLTLLLISTQSFAQKTSKKNDPFTGLDTAFVRVLKDCNAVGFAVAVVEKNKIIYSKGFGYRDLDKKLPVTPHTIFAIGSCTKAFTASLIGQLDQEGRLDIDKPVRNYLPELKFYNETMNNNITLRDMMSHRTGLPRHDYVWYQFNSGNRDSLIRRIQFLEPTTGIRERWQYNNLMYMAQGVVAQKLTDSSWEKNIAARLFKPLGMTESSCTLGDLQKASEASLGYGLKNDSVIRQLDYHDTDPIAPAGAINSNIIDMCAWVTTWINNGKYQNSQVLPADYVNQAISAQMVMGWGLPSKEFPDTYFNTYGFGWFLDSYQGHYRVEHGGNIDGFSANVCFFPSDSIGIVVLTNQNNSMVPNIVRDLIADRLLHLPYKDWSSYKKSIADKSRAEARAAQAARIAPVRTTTHPTHPLQDYTGHYSNPGYGSFEVTLQQDSLFVNFPKVTWWLKHLYYDIFDPFDKDPKTGIDTTVTGGPLKVQFQMSESGDINGITMNMEPSITNPVFFNRTLKEAALTPDQLQKYAGEYLVANLPVTLYVKGGVLHISAPGEGDYEMVPIGKDKFTLKSIKGFEEQFQLDDKGEVTGFLSVQPNGTFKVTKKK